MSLTKSHFIVQQWCGCYQNPLPFCGGSCDFLCMRSTTSSCITNMENLQPSLRTAGAGDARWSCNNPHEEPLPSVNDNYVEPSSSLHSEVLSRSTHTSVITMKQPLVHYKICSSMCLIPDNNNEYLNTFRQQSLPFSVWCYIELNNVELRVEEEGDDRHSKCGEN